MESRNLVNRIILNGFKKCEFFFLFADIRFFSHRKPEFGKPGYFKSL